MRWRPGMAIAVALPLLIGIAPAHPPHVTVGLTGKGKHAISQPMKTKGFSITDGVTTDIVFLILPDPAMSGHGQPRYRLSATQTRLYPCGDIATPCYVRFAANGRVQNVPTQWFHAYRFQWVGSHFDLYDVTPGQN